MRQCGRMIRYRVCNFNEGDILYCNHCGKKLSSEDLFCSQCGTKVPQPEPEPWDDSDNDFDHTRLYDPAETLAALDQTMPVDESSVQEGDVPRHSTFERPRNTYYERESSAKAAQRLSRRWQDAQQNVRPHQEEEDLQAPVAEPASPSMEKQSLFQRVTGQLGYGDHQQTGKVTASDKPAKASKKVKRFKDIPAVKKKEKSGGNYRSLYAGIVLLGIVIGIIFGLFLAKPWDSGQSGPAPVAGTATALTMEKGASVAE